MKVTVGKENSILIGEHAFNVEEELTITFFLLGSRVKGFIPSTQMFADFAKKLEQVLDPGHKGPRIITTHPFVSCMQVTLPKGPVLVGSVSKEDSEACIKLLNVQATKRKKKKEKAK